MTSVFAASMTKAWPITFHAQIHCFTLAGGVPSDPSVAEGWLQSKVFDKEALIHQLVAETMVERGIDRATAIEDVNKLKHLNGFKRDKEHSGELYYEGRQLKAGLKEAVNVCIGSGKLKTGRAWGETKKGITSYFPEHVFIAEERLHLGVTEPTTVIQSFPKNKRIGQTGIQYTEVCEDVSFDFTVVTDHNFTDDEWAMIWLTGEQQGIGASRSQGFGRYEVTRWDKA